MKTTTIILLIVIYVLSVYLSRVFNKEITLRDRDLGETAPRALWFVPVFNIVIMGFAVISVMNNKREKGDDTIIDKFFGSDW